MDPIANIDDVAFAQLLTPDAKQRAQRRINDLRQQYSTTSPQDFLNGLCDRAVAYSRYADIQRVRLWDRNLKYYRGSHDGHWDDGGTPWWISDDPTSAEGVFRINLYNYFVRSVEALWSRSNTIIDWKPRNDNPDTIGAAKTADIIDKAWVDHHWTATPRHLEAKHAQITGNYLRRFFFSGKSDQLAWRPKTESIQISGEDEGYLCNSCAMAGPLSDKNQSGTLQGTGMITGATMPPLAPDGSCPNCGSHEIDQFGLPPMTVDVVTGQEQFDPGDVIGEVIDPMEWTMHLHSQTWPLSPWGIRTRLFDVRILEAHFPWAEVPHSTTTDLRMIYQRMSQLDAGSDYSFLQDGGLHEMGQLEEFWFEPSMYAHYVTPPMITGDIQLDPNTALIEKHSEGCYLQRIGGHIVDGPWPANKSLEIVHGRFDVVMQNIWGRGQDDAVTSNERYEEEGTLAFEIAMNQASPPMAVNQMKIDWRTVSGGARALIKMVNAAKDDNPSQFIWQGGSMAAQGIVGLGQLMDRDERTMEKQFSSFPAFRGDPKRRAPTATQSALERDQTNSMHASPLELKEEVDAFSSMIRLKLYQKHWQGIRIFFSKGEYDNQEAQFFSKTDIQGDLIATARRGSSLPRGENERRAMLMEASNFGGLPLGVFNPQVPPKLRRAVLQDIGVQFDTDEIAADYRKQSWEINRLKEILPTVLQTFEESGIPAMFPPGMPNPDGSVTQEPSPNEQVAMFLASKIPVEMIRPPGVPPETMMGISIDNDEIHMMRITEWLNSDDGMEAHPVFRRALMIHSAQHMQAAMMTMQFKQMLMLGATAPTRAAQADEENAKSEKQDKGKKPARGGRGKTRGPDSGKKTAPRSEANAPKGHELQQRVAR